MFQNRMSTTARISRFVQFVILLVLLVVTSPVLAYDTCAGTTPAELNSTLRTYADTGEALRVELDVPSSGILSVDIAVSNTFSSDVGNGVLSLDCLPRDVPKPIVLERSPEHQVLAVSGSGSYVFRVAPTDRRRSLGALKVRSAFVDSTETGGTNYGEDEDEIEVDGLVDPGHNYGEDEDEIEVNGFADPGHNYGEDEDEIEVDGFADPSHKYGEDEDEIEVDGFVDPDHKYGEDEDEIEVDGFADPGHKYGEDEDEIEVDGFADPGHKYGEDEDEIEVDGLVYPGNLELCRLGEVDDHGDSFNCATFMSVGESVGGEIGNDWGDDADTFHFVLGGSDTDLWIVVIESAGDFDTLGILYDHMGQRLDMNGDRGRDGNFRITRALHPGAYFVRVKGRQGSEGPYSLRVGARR